MKIKAVLLILFFPLLLGAQKKYSLHTFPLNAVRLLDSPFKQAEQTDLKYILEMNPDRLLAPYFREAGLIPKAASYTNWENSGMDGHIGGHYVSALSLMFAATGNEKVLDRLKYMLNQLKECQDKIGTGYLGGVPGSKEFWKEIAEGKMEADGFSINKKWVPLYNIHKMYSGLRDAWLYANSNVAKEMLVRYTDWMIGITANLTDEQVQTMLKSEHGGLNEIFADVAGITGEKKYLELARRFSHQAILIPLSKKEDNLNNLHANTQIPKVIGFERIAELSGDTAFQTASYFFWENVVGRRTIAIGGNSVREHFHPSDNFSTMMTSEQGPETCNTYNMLKLAKMLYCDDGDEKYINYYERALYNHILSSQHPEKGGFVYFTPMRAGHYRVYSQPQTSMWCCVGSGMENHAKYGELIYAHNETDLYINLFIPSRLNWKEKGIILTQQTKFPEEEKTLLKIEEAKTSNFSIQIRYPVWVSSGALKISVNEQPVEITSFPGSYVVIKREWKKGDRINVSLPMKTTTEQLPDNSGYVAVLHGPIVLAAKTDTTGLKGLFADDSRMGHVPQGKLYPLHEMPLFVSDDADVAPNIKAVLNKNLTFTASNIILPEKYRSLELIPFYKLHDSRYVIYWQHVTPAELKQIQQALADKEVEKQKIEGRTLDLVVAGEQQPESDHFIESDRSTTGVTDDRHWRSAKGWFSYVLSDKGNQAQQLQVIYRVADKNKKFTISVNDEKITEVVLESGSTSDFLSTEYIIPPALVTRSKGKLTVKFTASDGSETANIFEVRLLKKQSDD